ncbi:hypothetical protein ACFIQF_22565 [Comamonas sp. J-3]|uniref:hypothetical protein n=1 Tax=Comamonas trifloxystrobinivorans TaxID=3350256 RepID=UPI003727C384
MSNNEFGFDVDAFVKESEKWDAKEFGASDKNAMKASDESVSLLHEAAGMKAVSIRMPVEMIQAYKYIAAHHGVGYQPLMRDILQRFLPEGLKEVVAAESERATASAQRIDEMNAKKAA